ncbi:MAG: 16S rRNA (cytosine(1402)-N(4))-methyltransferase RsmH [Patescibacteria group bacterium]
MKHQSVFLKETLKHLDPRPGEFIIDGTLDGGGHAEEILARISPGGKFLGVDLDPSMTTRFAERHKGEENILAVQGNYADLPAILAEHHLPKADGLLLDLGFSSEQLEESGRGFSFLRDEPLLMTYDPAARPVRELLQHVNERDLEKIISEYGGERYARRVAKGIKISGQRRKIATSGELRDLVRRSLPHGYERGRIDPATRTFQALRIWANDELKNVAQAMKNISQVVAPGGRIVVLSFHSLEDRIIKEAFRDGGRAGTLELYTKKPLEASRGEMRDNPRSRSAKLRAARVLVPGAVKEAPEKNEPHGKKSSYGRKHS